MRPRTPFAFPLLALLFLTAPADGQDHDHPTSPHAGAGSDTVETLTPEEVAGLLEGAGMGLARPAELNGYPGPRHVLELADSLRLSDGQLERTRSAFDIMHREAVALGRRIIDAEKALAGAFARGTGAASIRQHVDKIARLRGTLRWVHLRAHLEVREILTPHQRHEYDRLRGYPVHRH